MTHFIVNQALLEEIFGHRVMYRERLEINYFGIRKITAHNHK